MCVVILWYLEQNVWNGECVLCIYYKSLTNCWSTALLWLIVHLLSLVFCHHVAVWSKAYRSVSVRWSIHYNFLFSHQTFSLKHFKFISWFYFNSDCICLKLIVTFATCRLWEHGNICRIGDFICAFLYMNICIQVGVVLSGVSEIDYWHGKTINEVPRV